MLETPDKDLEHCFKIAKYFGIHINKNLDPKGLNITTNIGKMANQLIMHFHIHIIPRYKQKLDYIYWRDRELSSKSKEELIKILKTDKL